jgi:hypothetical protein
MASAIDGTSRTFRGTQVREDGKGASMVSHRHRVLVTRGVNKGLECEVASTRLMIGAAKSNDLVLTDSTVSRAHCEIAVRDDKYVVKDLGSTNGTKVNGTPILEAFLSPGDRIQVGDSEVLFEPKMKWVRIEPTETQTFGELHGVSENMRSVFGLLARVASTELTCLLVGETGTGKERARGVHGGRQGARRRVRAR